MALYLKTQESPEEIGGVIDGLAKELEKINKNFGVLESRTVSEKRIGDYSTSIEVGNDIIEIVVQGGLTRESKEFLTNIIGYERNMNIWFYRIKGNLEGHCFPITKFETKFAKYIGTTLIGEGRAERVTLAIPKDRIKTEKLEGTLRGTSKDYDFEHFHE